MSVFKNYFWAKLMKASSQFGEQAKEGIVVKCVKSHYNMVYLTSTNPDCRFEDLLTFINEAKGQYLGTKDGKDVLALLTPQQVFTYCKHSKKDIRFDFTSEIIYKRGIIREAA